MSARAAKLDAASRVWMPSPRRCETDALLPEKLAAGSGEEIKAFLLRGVRGVGSLESIEKEALEPADRASAISELDGAMELLQRVPPIGRQAIGDWLRRVDRRQVVQQPHIRSGVAAEDRHAGELPFEIIPHHRSRCVQERHVPFRIRSRENVEAAEFGEPGQLFEAAQGFVPGPLGRGSCVAESCPELARLRLGQAAVRRPRLPPEPDLLEQRELAGDRLRLQGRSFGRRRNRAVLRADAVQLQDEVGDALEFSRSPGNFGLGDFRLGRR